MALYISLQYPLLWTDIHLKVMRPKSESSSSNVVALLRDLLGRSFELPLIISFELHGDPADSSLAPILPPLIVLMRQSDRWAHLRVLVTTLGACTMLLPVKGMLPQLCSVRLKLDPLSTSLHDEDWVDTIRLFMSPASQIRK